MRATDRTAAATWSGGSKAAVIAGAVVASGSTLWAGRHNPSLVLHMLFAGWVLLPYAGLFGIQRWVRSYPPGISAAMYASTVALALFPAAIYAAVAVLAPGHPATAAFLVVPVVSWLAIGTMLLAARISRQK